MKNINLLLITLSFASAVSAQSPGTLDVTFGTNGKTSNGLFYPSLNERDEIRGIALQSDGKIVAAGFSNNGSNGDFSLARYNTNGTLDNTFGAAGAGTLTTPMGTGNDEGMGVAIQSDGKIIVAGLATHSVTFSKGFALARYNTNGTLDNTFGTTGKIVTSLGPNDGFATCIAIQSDGKIVVGGYYDNGSNTDWAMARYNTNGSLDNTFGTAGIRTHSLSVSNEQINAVAIQPDGKIIFGGSAVFSSVSRFVVGRYNANATSDATFSGSGYSIQNMGTVQDELYGMTLQPDGKIVAVGLVNNGSDHDIGMMRYNSTGSLDFTFNGNGKVIQSVLIGADVLRAVTLQADGKIVVAGFTDIDPTALFDENFLLMRFNTNGGIDNTFGTAGYTTTQFYPTGIRRDIGKAMLIQPDGKIVVGGYMENATDYDYAVARYNGSPLAINELSLINSVSVYPNPFTESVKIDYTLQNEESVSISLTDVQGRELKILSEKKMEVGVNSQTFNLPIELSAGLYFISVKSDSQQANYKLIKQ